MAEQSLMMTIDRRGVARLTLNRPDVRNAFNEDLIGRICDVMGRIAVDPNVRIVVITGAGNAFCAGADLNMMRRVAEYSPEENMDDARRLGHMLTTINQSPKPVIALVNGPALGGGVGLVAACDIAIASEDAFFALSEVRLGLIPAVISPFVVSAIGPRQARRWFLTGERFDAETARRLGLAHLSCLGAQLQATLDGVIDELLAGGPEAHRAAKSLIAAVADRPIDKAVLEDVAARIATTRASEEGKEGISAYLEKRRPAWDRRNDGE